MTPEIIRLMVEEVEKYPRMLHEQTEEGLVGKCPVCGELCPEDDSSGGSWRWIEYGYHRVDTIYTAPLDEDSARLVRMLGFADEGRKDDGEVGWIECSQGHKMRATENMEINWD